MRQHNQQTGIKAEDIASEHLKARKLQILDRNFHTRGGEIDIICRDSKTLVFVEVKSRIGYRLGKPYEAVTRRKIHHLKRAIYYYLLLHKDLNTLKMRLDVVSIQFSPDMTLEDLKHFENVALEDSY